MIFPFVNGILNFSRAPVTWVIFLVNLFVFTQTFQDSISQQEKLETLMRNETFSRLQGKVFARYVQEHSSRYPSSIVTLSDQAIETGGESKISLLGNLAMRDNLFLEGYANIKDVDDEIAFSWWKKKMDQIMDVRESHPSYSLGVTRSENNLHKWITYQFTHSGWSHFIGNMVFFLIFASSLESIVGGLGLLVVYLLSGVFSALSFSLLSEASAIPLIGASGAVSGIMALFCVLLWQKGVKYIFFLFIPKRGFAGVIYLPAWVALLMWVMSDLAGLWSTPIVLGGVAYSAHLGGELCGVLIALIIVIKRKVTGQSPITENMPFETKPIFTQYT